MIKNVKNQFGEDLTNADIDRILSDEEKVYVIKFGCLDCGYRYAKNTSMIDDIIEQCEN